MTTTSSSSSSSAAAATETPIHKIDQFIGTIFAKELNDKDDKVIVLDMEKAVKICKFVIEQCQELGGFFNIREASLLNDALTLLLATKDDDDATTSSVTLTSNITELDAVSLLIQALHVVQNKGRFFTLADASQVFKIVHFLAEQLKLKEEMQQKEKK